MPITLHIINTEMTLQSGGGKSSTTWLTGRQSNEDGFNRRWHSTPTEVAEATTTTTTKVAAAPTS